MLTICQSQTCNRRDSVWIPFSSLLSLCLPVFHHAKTIFDMQEEFEDTKGVIRIRNTPIDVNYLLIVYPDVSLLIWSSYPYKSLVIRLVR